MVGTYAGARLHFVNMGACERDKFSGSSSVNPALIVMRRLWVWFSLVAFDIPDHETSLVSLQCVYIHFVTFSKIADPLVISVDVAEQM